MVEENLSQEIRLKYIDEPIYYFIEDQMSKKYKKVSATLNYIEHLLILASVVTGCVSISALASLVVFQIDITYIELGLKIYAITAKIKNYKSIIRKKRKKDKKIVLLANFMLNTIEFLIFKGLIDSYINNDKFHFYFQIDFEMIKHDTNTKTLMILDRFDKFVEKCFMKKDPIEWISLTQAVHHLLDPKNTNLVFPRLVGSRLGT